MFMRHPLTFLSGLLTTRNRRWVGTPALVQEYFLTDHPVCSPTEVAGRLVNDSMRVGVEMLFGLRGNPRRVMTPILVVAAEYDALLPQAGQWQMAQAYGAEFRLIPRQGHDLMIEREWQQTAATIRVWLERLKPWLVDD
jgi:pimeloyl-ACP methyl ester carboxylesterase